MTPVLRISSVNPPSMNCVSNTTAIQSKNLLWSLSLLHPHSTSSLSLIPAFLWGSFPSLWAIAQGLTLRVSINTVFLSLFTPSSSNTSTFLQPFIGTSSLALRMVSHPPTPHLEFQHLMPSLLLCLFFLILCFGLSGCLLSSELLSLEMKRRRIRKGKELAGRKRKEGMK